MISFSALSGILLTPYYMTGPFNLISIRMDSFLDLWFIGSGNKYFTARNKNMQNDEDLDI